MQYTYLHMFIYICRRPSWGWRREKTQSCNNKFNQNPVAKKCVFTQRNKRWSDFEFGTTARDGQLRANHEMAGLRQQPIIFDYSFCLITYSGGPVGHLPTAQEIPLSAHKMCYLAIASFSICGLPKVVFTENTFGVSLVLNLNCYDESHQWYTK